MSLFKKNVENEVFGDSPSESEYFVYFDDTEDKNVENEVIEPTVFPDSPGEIIYSAYFDDPDGKFILMVWGVFSLMFCIGAFLEWFYSYII